MLLDAVLLFSPPVLWYKILLRVLGPVPGTQVICLSVAKVARNLHHWNRDAFYTHGVLRSSYTVEPAAFATPSK